MTEAIICENCGRVFEEDPTQTQGMQKQCPDCGSRAVVFSFGEISKVIVRDSVLLSDDVTLLMQTAVEMFDKAVVEKGDRTHEGEIIIAVTSVWYEIVKLLEKDPSLAYSIDPRKWEEIIAGLHERTGQFDKVILTPRSGDHGSDVIAERYGSYAFRIRDQVKRYNPNYPVTAEQVNSMLGTLHGDINTSKVIVTTTGVFAPRIMENQAIKALYPFRLELVDGVELRQRLIEYSKKACP